MSEEKHTDLIDLSAASGKASAPDQSSILIAVPTTGWANIALVEWLRAVLVKYDTVDFVLTDFRPVSHARNKIVELFLASDFSHLLTVDSDMIPPDDAIGKISKHIADGVHVVAGLCYMLDPDAPDGKLPTLFRWSGDFDDHVEVITEFEDGLLQVDATGPAFLCVARQIFERVSSAYWFDEVVCRNHVAGEEFYFFSLLKREGIKVYVDTSIRVGHIKETLI